MDDDTLLSGLVGAAVTVVLVFIPFAPLLGGGVAGYMRGRDGPGRSPTMHGGTVAGIIAGVVATVPAMLLGALVAGVFALIPMNPVTTGTVTDIAIFALFAFIAVIYFIGFSVLGGLVGTHIALNLDLDLDLGV